MLRRLSILSVCIILFITIFSQMVAAQDPNPVPRPARIYHIGILQTLEDGQPNPAYQPNGTVNVNNNITNYYFDSLQTLRADTSGSYFSIQHEGLTNGSFELRLYSDQVIPNPSDTGEFYSIWSDFSPTTKNVLITSADGTPKKISTPDGELANADFLRIDSSDISGGTGGGEEIHVNLYITKDISIKAGSGTSSNRYATSIKGDRFHAEGVTYVDGGPIVVTNSGSPGSPYGDNDHHSAVYLKGATFDGNTASPTSNGAILSLTNIASADLKDTTFKNSDADWQVYVFMDESTYRNTPNVTIQLGAAEEGTSSVLGEMNGRGGIKFAGNAPDGSYTVDVNGDGDFYQNQTIQTDNGNYSLTVNKNGQGTWYVADGITNEFYAQGASTTMNINDGGTLNIGDGSKIRLHGMEDTTLNINDNSTLNIGNNSLFEVHGEGSAPDTNGGVVDISDGTINIGEAAKFDVYSSVGYANLHMTNSVLNIGKDSELSIRTDTSYANANLGWRNTLNMGENAKVNVHAAAGSSIDLAFSTVNMERGSQLITTNDSASPSDLVDFFEADVTLNGGNYIETNNLSFQGATFHIDASALKYAYNKNEAVLTANVSSTNAYSINVVGGVTFDIQGVHSNINHQLIFQNEGSSEFVPIHYNLISATMDGVSIGTRSSITATVGPDGKSIFLDANFNNKILKWDGLMNPYWRLQVGASGNWRAENYESNPETAFQYFTASFIHNDAVIFDDHSVNPPSGYNIVIEPTKGVYLSQQNDWQTNVVDPANNIYQQHFVTEYGMRISSEHDWTFSGGSINDDFSPNPAAAFQDQKKHVARLIFDGTGSLRLNNTDANKFHDGLLIGNNSTGIDAGPSQLRAVRPDSLGSGEFAGEITDISIAKKDADGNIILKKDNSGNPILDANGNPTPEYEVRNGNPVKYVVQNEGYGIMFVDNGAEIKIDGGNKSTDDVMDQRIVVRQGSIGSLIVTPPVDPDEKILETVVTASGSYWKNQANFAEEIKHGGVAVVEDNAAFTMTGNFHFKNNVFLDSPGALSLKANFDGGVIWAGENANVVLDGNSYSENAVSRDGGVIWSGTGTNVSANNGTFTKNAAGEKGGAVYFTGGLTPEGENAKLLVTDSQFYNNKANLGGAVYINDSADVNLARSGFQFNGIGVQDDLDTGGNIIGEKADFSQIFTSKGGAVYINSNSNINFDGAAFNENGAINGGAIFTAKTKITGIKSIFQGNIARQSGGALHVNGAGTGVMTMSFSGAVFTDNEAGVHGGAVYLNPETVTDLILDFNRLQTPSTFINNLTHSVDSRGGAIYAGGTGITIRARDAKFEFNMAGRDGTGTGFQGGAVYMGNYDSLSAPQASFQGNRTNAVGGQGGAIYSGYGAKISLTGATFGYADIGDPDVDGNISPKIGNSASLHGGAIYTVGNSSEKFGLGELNIADTKFNVNGYKIIQQLTGILPLPSDYVFVESYEGNDYFYVPETQKGGAIYSGLTAITGDNAVFSQNGAVLDGGALYIQDDNSADKVNSQAAAEIVLTNGQFDRNFAATGSGGAIYLDATGYRSVSAPADSFDEILNIDGSKFYSNEAKIDGGAVYAKSHTTINANSTGINNIRPTEFGSYIEDPDNISSLPVGNIAGRNGGAVFLDGKVIGFNGLPEATSKLKADGAIFQYNQAGGDGGAVYLHYADAEIPNARFYYNTAVNRGGAIFFENEDGKNLDVEMNVFYQNQAAYGGAVYTVNKTIVHARETQFYVNTVSSDGGAFYFNADQSQLDASNAVFWGNDAQGSGGAVYMKDKSRFVSSDAKFFGNRAAIDGGAIRIGQLAEVMVNGAQFDNNTASYGNGGAVMIDDRRTMIDYSDSLNILNADNARFTANTAQGMGGAVYAPNTNISADGSTFESNAVSQDGGAVYAQNSDLIAKNAYFTGNTAAGKGGAVYFLTTNGLDRIIYLGASDNLRSSFSNNKSGTFADTLFNSIYFDAQSADDATNVKLNITTGKNGNLEMLDPLVVDKVNNNINLDIVKTGSGIWSLAGINDLTTTTVGTTVDINGGTLKLQSGGNLLLTNVDANDHIKISAGGIFATAEPLTPNLIHRLNTTNLNFAGGSKMQLGGNLELNVASDYTISSSLSGNGALTKKDKNVLNFRGNTINYNGNINIEAGELNIVKDSVIANSGHFTTQGIFSMAPNTVLRVNADPTAPTIVAKSANIDHVNLYIGGISGEYDNNFYLIHTEDGITGDFNSVNSVVGSLEDIDYLTYKLGFLNDHKDYGGTIGLRWYSNDDTLKARGQFTLTNAEDYFNVAVELHDTNINLYPGDPNDPSYDPGWQTRWNGKSLDKLGLGTLELSRANTYSGKTTVYAGELLLSDKQATGLGNTAVEVKQDARLGFNFDGKYLKTINGEGQVVQHGGTVELSGTNNYSGGTVLKGGIMEFVTGKSFGTGTITFDGGTMRNKAETVLTQQMIVANGKNAKFETPAFEESTRSIFVNSSKASLTVSSNISGNGGLEKTGEGILALTGKNTFIRPAYVQNGGLQIDGSVISDVRVQADAAVSGTGTVGGDLFIAKNGYFDWYFSPNQAASGPLNVGGSLYIAEGAVFRPRTDSTNFSDPIVGWTVLNYGKTLGGQFIGIDDTFNAFYNFELDYSVPGEVRVNGELLAQPKPLSDIVTAGLYIADRKLYRTSFNELMRETVYRKSALTANRSVRGQMIAQPTRSAWFAPIARENSFGSSYVGGDYDLHAYGAQTGSTLWSNGNSSLGFMIGYERGQLKNNLDWIRSHDYQLGLYFGHVYSSGYEFRGFIGGGFQTFTAARQADWFQGYKTKYDGSSFEMNAEIGKFFAGQNGTLLRPYIAFDIEHAGQTAAQENRDGNAFRDYGRSDLSQFFFRFGADLEKRWQYNDINVGLSFSELIFGQTHAKAPIFYPVRDAGTTSYGARLGRASVTFKAGWNWYFNRKRTSSFTLDYYADLYLDRENHDTAQQTGSAGIQVRF